MRSVAPTAATAVSHARRTLVTGLAGWTACALWPVASTPALAASSAASWPGVIELAVDATDLDRRVLWVQQRLPVKTTGQRLTLRLARFLPGTHGPWGDAVRLAGLVIEAAGQRLPWRRDGVDTHAYQVEVPAGVHTLALRFQYLSPLRASGDDRVCITRQMLGIQWETVLLYPDGPAASAIRVQPRLKLPSGWQEASALRGTDGQRPSADAEGWRQYAELSLETLIDSPLFAGRHLRRIELDAPGSARPVVLNLLADAPEQLDASPAQLDAHRALVQQADRLFGSRPYRQYDFLLAQSDEFGGIGLEHHESSENALQPGYFKDWELAIRGRELLAHEYVHTWNGKTRRPADLATPDYHQPMVNSLLWIYEGQTQYWGQVLATRAGLISVEQSRDRLAWRVAELDASSGQLWRSLQDSTLDPTHGAGHNREWSSWQRNYDYYNEGLLVWLEVDTLIRQRSQDQRSLDDVARRFLGVAPRWHADGSPQVQPYRLDDVLAALQAVQPGDWAGLLRQRLERAGDNGPRPADRLAGTGWRLGWSDKESSFASNERGWSGPSGHERPQDMAFSLGLRVVSDGKLDEVLWNSPAFRAGLAPGMTLLAVNDSAYRADRLSAAVAAAQGNGPALRLLLRSGDHFFSCTPDWRGGLRYPVLERVAGEPDRLAGILAARAGG